MKKITLGILLLFSVCSVAFAENPWELKKDKDGIKASVREVEGSKILEYKGEVVLETEVDEAIELFEDDNKTVDWFHGCAVSKSLEEISPDEEVFYTVISMPWPVSDRDMVFLRVRAKDAESGAVEYKNSAKPDAYPEQKKKVRMPYLKETWRFTPLEDGRTAMVYQSHSEVGGSIPAWLVNKLAVNTPYESLSDFREIVEKD